MIDMRKTLLFGVALLVGASASAQCTPDQLYADSVYGVWPDTTENFANGMVNVFYTDTLNILVPSDAGLINTLYAGYAIDSVALNDVTNLPAGLSVTCNSQTNAPCTFLPNQVGCGLIEGMPTTAGTYDLTVNVTAYAVVFGFTVPVPQSFAGYTITVLPGGTGVNELGAITLDQVRTIPNPAQQRTNMEFMLNRAATARVKVFNLVGEQLWKHTVEGKQGLNTVPFDASELENGIYLYKVEAAGRTFTGRMVISR